ncbi:MAG: hypothetical protein HYU65_06180 [Armatimonadetes bacterium]|nr:hypothetical protein [Armatimonadota bacterium]
MSEVRGPRSGTRERAEDLRREIVEDLEALKTVVLQGRAVRFGRDAASVPAWLAGAVAGIMAGLWSATRRRSAESTTKRL